ncbi:hypothetical protein SF1_18660 [Sphingobacterium faecium NBRC 15299]|uniref:DUF3408 domain-containing protein n=1 Tax=Sphingobacterium faecium TaxID=34087 RepID=UPI000D397383|nr:DUF3408 domain-containing protein [Sphingobacterium faecium]PTX09495.1 uncharacterized protein DUF3408 [Sphingobacterium faecium]GEM63884.1 hypothetical protein SF1_18660 [Sphingobacterium faecium NBRC 15299]
MGNEKKKTSPGINAELMMSMMEEGVKKEGLQVPVETTSVDAPSNDAPVKEQGLNKANTREKSKVRRSSEVEYESIFFRRTDTNARDGKTVYIRPEFHDKLSRIVQVIGEDKLSIYAYLDNLLDYHFKEFGEQITKSYNDKYKPIL